MLETVIEADLDQSKFRQNGFMTTISPMSESNSFQAAVGGAVVARRFVPIVALLVLLGCASLPGAQILETGESRHSYALAGNADPVVVFESGLGDGKESWRFVFEPVSEFARVLAYDRGGYGGSRTRNENRDGAVIVEELRELLEALGLAPPYVLVGHSIGGHFVELFARTYPQEVAGVVFVDARSADFSDRCIREDAERCTVPAVAKLLMPGGARAELMASSETERQIREAGAFPEVPVRVLTATRRPDDMPNLKRAWAEAQVALAGMSPLATQEICDTCGHYIQHDAPDRVVSAIRSILE